MKGYAKEFAGKSFGKEHEQARTFTSYLEEHVWLPSSSETEICSRFAIIRGSSCPSGMPPCSLCSRRIFCLAYTSETGTHTYLQGELKPEEAKTAITQDSAPHSGATSSSTGNTRSTAGIQEHTRLHNQTPEQLKHLQHGDHNSLGSTARP